MTATIEPSAPTPAEPQLLPDEATAEPYHFNRGMLRQLNACGPYVRRHHELFPTTEYPDGPPINSVTCRTHHEAFSWTWAMDEMLNYNGRHEVELVANSRAERYRALGPGRASNQRRLAAAFGYVFATRPELRHQRMTQLAEHASAHADQAIRDDLREVEQTIRDANRELAHWTEAKARAEAELPALRAAVEGIRVRAAARLVAEKEQEVRRATAALRKLKSEAAELREAASALATAAPAGEQS